MRVVTGRAQASVMASAGGWALSGWLTELGDQRSWTEDTHTGRGERREEALVLNYNREVIKKKRYLSLKR